MFQRKRLGNINVLTFSMALDNLPKNLSDKGKSYDEIQICELLDFLIDNIYVKFGDKTFRQVGYPNGDKLRSSAC